MLGLAASMCSMYCQLLREHGWLGQFGATRVRAPGVLMPLLGLLPLLDHHRYRAGAKHLLCCREPFVLLPLLPCCLCLLSSAAVASCVAACWFNSVRACVPSRFCNSQAKLKARLKKANLEYVLLAGSPLSP